MNCCLIPYVVLFWPAGPLYIWAKYFMNDLRMLKYLRNRIILFVEEPTVNCSIIHWTNMWRTSTEQLRKDPEHAPRFDSLSEDSDTQNFTKSVKFIQTQNVHS